MADPDAASAAFARAWSAYRMINHDVRDDDKRRDSLERFIRQRYEAGVDDPELLAVAGLKFLKELDPPGTSSR
jgi:hypothetical protein